MRRRASRSSLKAVGSYFDDAPISTHNCFIVLAFLWTRKDGASAGLYQGMRPMPLGWMFVTLWGVVCVLLALGILALMVR
jgi:hypothetical protein